MVWLYFFILLLAVVCGMVLLIFTLPGLWLMTAAAACYAVLTLHLYNHLYLGIKTLVALLLLSVVGEILELALVGTEARKAGGSRKAMLGGIIGGFVGGIFLSFLIPIPVIGTIFGFCLGSFIGAAAVELLGGRAADHSLRVGIGAAKGRFLGIVSKLAIGLVMALLIFFTALPIH